MVQFIPGRNEWADAFREIGAGASQGYMNRADEIALQKAISSLPENATPRQRLDAITNTKTHSPAAKQGALKNYLGVSQFEEVQRHAKERETLQKANNDIKAAKENRVRGKEEIDRAATKSIVSQLDVSPELKEQLGETLPLSEATGLFKNQLKQAKEGQKLTPFEKKVQDKQAEDYINLTKEVPKLQSTLGDLQYARKLSRELGVTGAVKGALGLSKKAKELEGISFTLMEPIIKIFNPSGPIAQQKLKLIQDKYVIKASDAPWTKEAKLDALERFSKQALNRAQDRLKLYEKYNGSPPTEEVTNFDKESETVIDAMTDYDLIGEEVDLKGIPEAKGFKGKTITSPDGKKYYSDGIRWMKK